MVFCRHRDDEYYCSLHEVRIGNDGCKNFSPAFAALETGGRASKKAL
jgi:hypothetical protein